MQVRQRAFLIAEIGINHGGSLGAAKRMVQLAKDAGADMAKFQLYRPAVILGKSSPYFAEASNAQLKKADHVELKAFCESIGIEYGVSLFHVDHILWAEQIGLKRYKVASRSITDMGLLNAINKTKKPVIISTGMAIARDVKKALQWTDECASQTLLYCVSAYPTLLKNMSLSGAQFYEQFVPRVGISSHCPNIAPAIAAVARGASVVEHHVCFSRNDAGCDVPSSLTFEEFHQMSTIIRDLEKMSA
jgi:N,N'-diacetyllegionaminate synthase